MAGFFDIPERWEDEWQGMPEFIQEDQSPFKTIFVHFENREDMLLFAELVDQRLTTKTQSIWYPEAKIDRYSDKRYVDQDNSLEPWR